MGHADDFEVRWRNFKGLADTSWVRIRPLTILLGANSSGKSSFIAPLLLLKQSLLSRTGGNALLTRGEYIDAGAYADFVHNHDLSEQVNFAIRWQYHARPARELQPVGAYEPSGAEFVFDQGEAPESVRLNSYRVWDAYRRTMLRRVLTPEGKYSLELAKPRTTRSRTAGSREDMRLEKLMNRAMRRAMRDALPVDFLFASEQVRRAAVEASVDVDAPKFPFSIDDARVRLYCQIADSVEWRLRGLFDDLNYLGPLREPPRRVYELSGEMPADVGTRGEHAAEIIYRWRNNPDRLEELREWLARFDIAEDVAWEAVGTGGFSLMLRGHGGTVRTSVSDMGFGISQILPLIVQGLRSPPGSWLITEQPEIHLNPRLEAEVADLFAHFVSRRVGVVVETHSEHFLLRLRRLVAEGVLKSEDVALYFVEHVGDESRIRLVPIEESGRIDRKSWPRGFFEDALREAMALAQAQAARGPAHPS